MICYPAAKRHHILVCVHKREEEANMAGVLEGITVLDLAQNWAGPGVSMYLADQGASVIKVEPPGGDAAIDSGQCSNGEWRGRSGHHAGSCAPNA